MKNFNFTFQAKKYAACGLHLFFLTVMFIGVGLMYLNDNYGLGIKNIHTASYEDTKEFNGQFNKDLKDLFHYVEYNGVFATDGSVDVTKTMLQMTFGPNETMAYNLGDLISHLQSIGYELNDNFECRGTPDPALSEKSPQGYVEWSASAPKEVHSGLRADMKRVSLEEISLEIMANLQRYYVTYNRFMVNPSNLHFMIEYTNPQRAGSRRTIYTNDSAITQETMREYGKYAYLAGNSVFFDTNLSSISLNTISTMAANNPYTGNTYYLLAAVDTTYPNHDLYYRDYLAFRDMQNNYISGFVLILLGGLMTLVTLLYLMTVSGHKSGNDKTITLHKFDKSSTETGIVMFGLLTLGGLGVCRYAMVRMLHLFMAESDWVFTERVLYAAVLYLGALLLFFSLLRRYKAGCLWQGSLVYKALTKFSTISTGQSFTAGLTFGFISYLAANGFLAGLLWFLYSRAYLDSIIRITLSAIVILTFVILNLWVFYLLFRGAAAQDKIRLAIERLAAGETSYQVNLYEFEGKEWELALNINNISSGLEAALTEKVKSERLKTDLITNVSHDIKTPLTSIINYVDLIRREHISDEKLCRYLDVLEQKSQRLKTLTDDLVEASKASSGNLKLEISNIDFIELIYQTNGEFEEKFSSRHLELITNAPDETLIIEADGRRLWRVLENLYNNAFKYAMDGSRIYVDIIKKEPETTNEEGIVTPAQVVLTIKNVSSNPLNIRGEDLTERFVRGDVARTTEGSGLGLSIAKSLTELQNGRFEIHIDGDLFKVLVAFDVKRYLQSIPTETESSQI